MNEILLKNLRSSFESLRACPEFIEGTNGGAVEIIGDFPFIDEPSRSIHRVFQRNLNKMPDPVPKIRFAESYLLL